MIPDWILAWVAVPAVFTLMFHLGMIVAPGEYRLAWRKPGLMLKGLFASLVAVPMLVVVVARAFDLPRPVEIGMVLMAISPGAPVALRRALSAGGDHTFAPALQVAVATLAVVSMPLSIAAFDEVYAGRAAVEPAQLARQLFFAQLLPLALGMGARRFFGARLASFEPFVGRLATALLVIFVALAFLDVWRAVAGAGGRGALAMACANLAALACGHLLGGPSAETRTALGVACTARNAGLAMLVASVNNAAPAIKATLIAYLVVSALVATPYVFWRRRIGAAPPKARAP